MAEHGILVIDKITETASHYPVQHLSQGIKGGFNRGKISTCVSDKWQHQKIMNVSGSGDTFTAGLAVKIMENKWQPGDLKNLDLAVKFGLESAQYSLRSFQTVSDRVGDVSDSDSVSWQRFAVN